MTSEAMKYATLTSEDMRTWLKNHRLAISMGVNVGQIDRNKAQAFSLELIRRGESLR